MRPETQLRDGGDVALQDRPKPGPGRRREHPATRTESTRQYQGEVRRLTRPAAAAVAVLVPIGLLALGYAGFHRWGTDLAETRHQRSLGGDLSARLEKAQFLAGNTQLDQQVARAEPGQAVARLRIPALGLDRVVVEGTSSGALQRGPGRHRASAPVGQVGNAVVVGRRTSYGSPFEHLRRLKVGDRVEALSEEGRFVYRVTGVTSTRAGDERIFRHVSGRSSITLLTSEPGNRQRWTTVTAQLEGDPIPETARAGTTAISQAELSLVGDPGAWALVLLWAQAVAVVWMARRWLRRRWPVWSTWLVTTPVLVAAAFVLFESADRLLPPTL